MQTYEILRLFLKKFSLLVSQLSILRRQLNSTFVATSVHAREYLCQSHTEGAKEPITDMAMAMALWTRNLAGLQNISGIFHVFVQDP